MADREISIEIKRPELIVLLAFLILIFYFEIQVTLNSPIAFGDEGFHTFLARWIGTKIEYPTFIPQHGGALFEEGFVRPPMWNVLEGSFYFIFGFSDVIVKLLAPFIAFMTAISSYLLVKKVFSERVAIITSAILVTIPSYVTYSILFYVDILLVFWFNLAFLTFLIFAKTQNKKYFIMSSLFTSFAILTKQQGFILVIFYALYFVYQFYKKADLANFYSLLRTYFPPMVLLLIVISGWIIRNGYYFGAWLYEGPFPFWQGKTLFVGNYTNVNSFSGDTSGGGTEINLLNFGIINYLSFAYGYIWFVPLLFILGLSFLLFRRGQFDLMMILMLISGLIILNTVLKSRSEDAARHILFAVPVVGLIASIYLDQLSEFVKKVQKYFPYLVLLAVFLISFYTSQGKLSDARHYEPALSSACTPSNPSCYVGFKMFSQDFFQACDWVKKNPNQVPPDSILLSLNSHPTVYNCERSAFWDFPDLPDILLGDVNLSASRLKAEGITHIFVQKFALSTQNLRLSYPVNFVRMMDQNNQTFVKIYENGPSINACISSGGCDGTIIYRFVG